MSYASSHGGDDYSLEQWSESIVLMATLLNELIVMVGEIAKVDSMMKKGS